MPANRSQPSKDPFLRQLQFDTDSRIGFPYVPLSGENAQLLHIRSKIGQAALNLIELHKGLSLGRITQKPVSERLAKDIVPEIAIQRTRLANLMHVDIANRVRAVEEIPPLDITAATMLLGHAGGVIDIRLGVLGRGAASRQVDRDRIAREAVPELHVAAEGLALQYQLGSITEMHQERLQLYVRQPGLAR